jgi:protocatechuate 3,4-dioxygenase beta subunit
VPAAKEGGIAMKIAIGTLIAIFSALLVIPLAGKVFDTDDPDVERQDWIAVENPGENAEPPEAGAGDAPADDPAKATGEIEGDSPEDGGEPGNPGDPPPAGDVAPPDAGGKGTVIFGRVLDEDGKPVPDALVQIGPPGKQRSVSKASRETRSLSDGTWRFENLPADRLWRINVSKHGFALWRKNLGVVREERREVVANVHRSWSARVKILDVDGNPVLAGVSVMIRSKRRGRGFRLQPQEDGTYLIRDVDPEFFPLDGSSVTFKHDDYLDTRLENLLQYPEKGGWVTLRTVLREGASITGTVTGPGGKALAGANVRISEAGANFFDDKARAFRTDDRGAYTARGLEKGTYVVRAWTEDLILEHPLEVGVAEYEIVTRHLELGTGRVVSGRLVGPDGNPVQGIPYQVSQHELGRGLIFGALHRGGSRTGADGEFEIRGLPLDRRDFSIEFEGLGGPMGGKLPAEVIDATASRMVVLVRTEELPSKASPPPGAQVMIVKATCTVTFPREKK